ncbi:CPBP family intramembrane glutamic endopeptidase [Nostoc sp. LEGE 12447]|uniref:CPBP family glutamic-type intramembrane protease n=1 Tax=unclassified Nostoc TaxID=2593658 RepID=UPI0013D71929|nr:CPBP family intramembrane glutamic endopeptidase [Nostoc sp. LEGE 12447]MBE8999058.1 CPBP family intramembrane metalloprotease [Nostoc sp. LEGE 12447]NEU80802.1 CPBP family intramembrane metalloprotease [Nostoc sp. UIC 10630]
MVEQQKQEPEIPYLTRIQVLGAMGATAIILLIVAKLSLHFGNFSLFSWKWDEKDLLLGVGLGFVITALSGIAYRVWTPYRKSADYYLEVVLKPLALPDLIWLGLLPGLSEELLFRGVMLSALGLDHLAVIVSSFCFGILHFSGSQQWPYVIWATIVGMILAYSALLTGNLLVPIVAHMITNWISSYFWKMWQLRQLKNKF